MGENLEYSSIDMSASDLVAASVEGIQERYGQKYVSPELFLGTQIGIVGSEGTEIGKGLVRGVTPSALLVRRSVQLEEGQWPQPGEVIVGRLVAAKLDADDADLAVGKMLRFEGRDWRISGVFSAGGAAFESEVWSRLDELQQAMKRQDLSVVAVTLAPGADFADLDLFCMERLDLELQAMPETEYYASLQRDYGPVRMLAWLVVLLVAGAGIFAGLNTMYGSVVGRIRELAALQTIGFVRRAILVSLVQEGLILAAAASLLATLAALLLINDAAVRFTMGAFSLRIDEVAVLVGCGVGLLLGVLGAVPPGLRALSMPIVEGLKST
jgi:ABC-type lipoprotein release transport system permease subunit